MSPSLFHLPTTLLPLGPTLIEASAGTGKTFTLAGLFLRLLLEHGLSHRHILIVTYTEAATEDLRGRIRARLAEAHAAFAPEATTEDPLFIALRGRLVANDPDFRHARATLHQALTGFDETPIHTIHGFCQRVLRDRAFESGSLFDVELVTDPRPLLDELVADWWRAQFHGASLMETGFAVASGLSPETLRRLLDETQRHPGLTLCAEVQADDLPRLRQELADVFATAADLWRREGTSIRACFGDHATWGNKPYNRTVEMASKFAQLEACFSGTAGTEDFGVFPEFTPEAFEAARNKRKKDGFVPTHPFFVCGAELSTLQQKLHTAWLLVFSTWVVTELKQRKLERKVQSFDDLLTRLDVALAGDGGDALAAVVRSSYAAALIDEFQDTDPVQWRIFRRLFGEADQRLFLIGDPKQAIYGFRGADVFTYLSAAAAAPHAHTLGTNWRSESGLVAAVNGIFKDHSCPFVEREIQFHPVAAGRADAEPLTEGSQRVAPFQLWFWAEDQSLSKTKAEPQLAEMVASEIVRLLSSATNVRLGDRPLQPADIAVLVESHQQASMVAHALWRRGVPSVQQTQNGVFASHEAEQLQTLLGAIAEPTRERLLRAALATDILGLEAARLDSLAQDEAAWAGWLEQFCRWSDRWQSVGFLPMFRELLQTQHVRKRWLTLADGERRLTNLLHVAELLHTAASERQLGVNGLRQHLAHRCAHADEAGDEELLRLERDDNAVQLVTIHRSKGLEYSVVFCPFSFRAAESGRSQRPNELVLCHDPADRTTMLGDLGSPQRDEHERLAAEERLAENVRLLYVALTRARNRCYFAWGDFKERTTTAPTWLFTPPPGLPQGVNPVAALAASGRESTVEIKRNALEILAERIAEAARQSAASLQLAVGKARTAQASEPALRKSGRPTLPVANRQHFVPPLAVTVPPTPDATRWTPPAGSGTPLTPRNFTATIPRDWRVASFSWLTAGRRTEAPDYDAVGLTPALTLARNDLARDHPGRSALSAHDAMENPTSDMVPSTQRPGWPRAENIAVVHHPDAALSPAPGGIHAFPRGTEAGTCLHKIFERIDFTTALTDEAALGQVISGALREHAMDARTFAPAVADMVRRTLTVSLTPNRFTSARAENGVDAPPLTLGQVPAPARLNEFEFCFPLRRFTPGDLRDVLTRHGANLPAGFPHALERLTFNPVEGVLRGFIDLVFCHEGKWWLADWKSNWLGSRAEDYTPATIAAAMAEHFYPLQYLLYTLALDRWLALRVSDYDYMRDFYGVRYLFLRGLDPARPELGVFADKPRVGLLRELGELLLAPTDPVAAEVTRL